MYLDPHPDSPAYVDAQQALLFDRYATNGQDALTTLTAQVIVDGTSFQLISCRTADEFKVLRFGLHSATGGSGNLACPAQFMLLGLAGCFGATFKRVAGRRKLQFNSAVVCVAGDFDARGTLGLVKGMPVGFTEIRLEVVIYTETSDKVLESIQKSVVRACVVHQTFVGNPNLNVDVKFKRVSNSGGVVGPAATTSVSVSPVNDETVADMLLAVLAHGGQQAAEIKWRIQNAYAGLAPVKALR